MHDKPIADFQVGSSPLARGLLFFVLGNLLVALGMQIAFQVPFRNTDLAETAGFLRLRPGSLDSWIPMSEALAYWREHPEKSIYNKIFFEDRIKFQYPPTSLLVLLWTDSSRSPVAILNHISRLFVAITAVAAILIFMRASNRGRNRLAWGRSAWSSLAAGFLVGCLALTFYPVIKAYSLGQIQVWINALFALAILNWMQGRKKWCGFLMGIVCLIKPQYGAIVIWGVFRRQWGFVLTAAATGLVGLTASLALFGVENHLDYLRVLSFMSRHGESFYPNQSMNGFLNRLLGNGDNLEWEANMFAPYHPVVYVGTLAGSLILLAVAWFWPVARSEKGSTVDFALMALAGTMASPIAWEHHYGILLPIYALLLPRLLQERNGRSVMVGGLALSYVLTSHFMIATNRLAATPFNFVQSYLWFGALIVLAILLRLRGRSAEAAATQFDRNNVSSRRSGPVRADAA